MAKLVFIGAATAKPQITTITISGTWAAGETVTLKVAEKEVTYTATGTPTTSTVAAGLLAACQASDDAEFADVETWSVDTNVVTATSIAGVPVSITATETAASGSVAVSNTQAATGPNHWDDVDNWSTGAVPSSSDEVSFEIPGMKALYGLPTSLTLSKFVCKTGQVGLPDLNASGYSEYRTKRAVFSCTTVEIGSEPGKGPDLCRIDLSTSAAQVVVWGSPNNNVYAPVDLLLNSSSATVSVVSGNVWVAAGGAETSTILTLRNSGGGVYVGPGLTVTNIFSAGSTVIACSPTNLTVDNGTTTLVGASAISGTTNVQGGTLLHKSTGTIAAATVGPGTLDRSQDLRTATISSLTLKKGGTLRDPYNVLTLSAGIALGTDVDQVVAS